MLGDMGDGLPKQSAAINDKLDQQCQRQREKLSHTKRTRPTGSWHRTVAQRVRQGEGVGV